MQRNCGGANADRRGANSLSHVGEFVHEPNRTGRRGVKNAASSKQFFKEATKMRKMRILALVVLLASGLAFAAQMPQGVRTQKSDAGTMVLADAKGMTLYTYDKDEPGKSNCNGLCAHFWPPMTAPADAQLMSDWTVISRKDGSKQWAYRDKPLYTFGKDKKPGETKGEGSGNVWHQATP